jgi:3-hydroxyacyl-[acyl-carrier-protein] dehydratase
MPPTLLFDISTIDLDKKPVFTKDDIEKVNPQRFEMQQLDGIIWYDQEKQLILGYKDITENEFWIDGHIPGRPLMPGVIMIEAAAQLLSFFVMKLFEEGEFIGFGGIQSAKFRSILEPGSRLLLLGHITEARRRRYKCDVQGVANSKLIFEASIFGMKV